MTNTLIWLLLKANKFLFRSKFRLAHIVAFIKYNSFLKFINLINSNFERLTRKTILSSKPYLFNSELTNHCFLNCIFCPTGKSNMRQNGYANPQLYENVFNGLYKYLYLATFHGWGEPLMHKNFDNIINLARSRNICSVLNTNGMLLRREISEKIINCKLDVLYVSINGVDEESYLKYHHGGSFKIIMENLKNLIDLKKKYKSETPYIEWQFVIFKHNEHQVDKAKKIAKEIEVDSIVFLPSYTEDVNFEPSNPKFILPRNCPIRKKSQCKHLWSTITTHWNGKVVQCCYDYDEKTSYGDIEKESVLQIWNNSCFQNSRQVIKSGYSRNYNNLTCNLCVNKLNLES